MSDIGVSVIVPTLNEERDIETFLARVSRALDAHRLRQGSGGQDGSAWEILVVDDGSSDRTASLVEQWSARDRRIHLLRGAHRGKGSAIRRGMLAARGGWRMMADTDLSVAPEDWSMFLDTTHHDDAADLIIGSREAPGARRIGEPLSRHLIGRVFNWLVRLVAVPGVRDTQCGFKMLSQRAAETLVPHLTVEGFAFDVELLYLARRSGFRIREAGVVWTCRTDSRVRMSRGLAAFVDIARIRWRGLRGRYDRLDASAGQVSEKTHGAS